MRMILKSLHIQNFKGCKDRVIDFGDKTSIKGVNGCGKTTVADAVMWVLFGKSLDGSSSFDIRPKDKAGVDVDFVDIVVKVEFEVDGKSLEITKTQKQNWVTKRGSEEQTFQGNTNLYEVNTIPKAEKEFKSYIEALVPEEVFKFVSNTNAFMAQKAVDRRKTLFKLVADMTDEDVLATDPKLSAGLSGELSRFTAEEILSRDKKALSEYKDKLDKLPSRIDEVSRTIVEEDYAERELQLNALREQMVEVESKVGDTSKAYDQVNQLRAEISQANGKLQEIERTEQDKFSTTRRTASNRLSDIEQSLNGATSRKIRTEQYTERLKGTIGSDEAYLKKLGEDYTAEKSKEMAEGTNLCPVCKQEYPEDIKETMVLAFTTEKDRRLLEINRKGKDIAEGIKNSKAELVDYEKQLEDEKAEIITLTQEKENLQKELETLPAGTVDLSTNADYWAVKKSLVGLESGLEIAINLTEDAEALKQSILEQKRSIQAEIDTVQRLIARKQVVEDAKDRVEELKAEQKKLSQDIATVEKEIYLLEEFNKAKVNLLSEKINSHFKIVRWKLFNRLINGGYEPICEPLVNGQSYSSALNSGHKILAELDIIQALQKIYEVSVPVFLDNAERINDFNVPEMDCQLVTLSVVDPVYFEGRCVYDGSLKVEVA